MLNLCTVFDPQQALGIYKLYLGKMGCKTQKSFRKRVTWELPNSKLPNKFGYGQKGLQEGQRKEENEFSGVRAVGTTYTQEILVNMHNGEQEDRTSEEKEVVTSCGKQGNCFRSSEGKKHLLQPETFSHSRVEGRHLN